MHRQAPDREFITKREEELLMRTFLRVRPLAGLATLSACALVVAVPASLAEASVQNNSGNQFRQTNLISNRTDQQATGGTHTLLFSAGINDEKDGLVGAINAVG
jgi:hypothetical protein